MMLIGMATLPMMVFPIWINSAAEKLCIERVNVNQVPQKTPITNADSIKLANSATFNFTKTKNERTMPVTKIDNPARRVYFLMRFPSSL